MIGVTDLLDYLRCKRRLWFSKCAKIKKPNIGYGQGRRFHSVVQDIYEQISSAWEREGIPGKLVRTEVKLEYGGLVGRIDYLRRTNEGYIIHEEKYQEPPKKYVYPEHKIQLDAYAFLAEKCGYAPVISAYIVYNDLRPRELKPEPETIPKLVEEVRSFLSADDVLPPAEEEKCESCSYYPLCQVLPLSGGIKKDHLEIFKQVETRAKLIRELEESLKLIGFVREPK